MITQASNLNLVPERSVPVIVHVSQFDTGSRTLSFRLFNGSTSFSVPSGASVKIQGMKKDGNAFEYPMTVSGSTVSVLVDEQMTVIEGEVKCQIVITQGSNVLGTANFILLVEPSPINDGTISESNIPAIITLINGGEVGQFLSWGENGAEWSDNGSGDMNKATYDTNDDGIVDNAENARNAEKVNGKTVARDVLANEYTNSQIDTALSAKANASDVNTALALKQDTLTFDATPTQDSPNPVTSGGIFLSQKAQDNKFETLADLLNAKYADDWATIQTMIQIGYGKKYYPVGTQFTVHHNVYGDMLFDVIGHDHDLPAGKDHSMTLLMHNVIYSTQFDEVEGFYYCENGLTAGTYNVTITRQPWFAGDVGKTFQFTLANDVPAGAILWWDGYNVSREGRTVRVYNTRGATSAAQTATMTEGNAGTSLGSIDGTGNCNFFDRTVLGSNDWEESGVRQWLNADAASDWWEPKTNWDRLVNYYSRPGFLYGFDADFKNVLVETTHGNRSNTVFDSHGTNSAYSTSEKFFLLCNEEVNLAQEQSIVCGTVYDYYRNAADADRIKYDITSAGTARYWWLRSPHPSSAHYERHVNTSGALSNTNAYNGYGVAAACVIA